VSEGERNYHIFYYLVKGTSEEEKARYFLKKNTTDYFYLNQSSVTTIPGISDEASFNLIKKEFELYLDQGEIEAVLRILSVVLTAGNIKFRKVETANSGESAVIENPEELKRIS
jgi:myosin heavy subunit